MNKECNIDNYGLIDLSYDATTGTYIETWITILNRSKVTNYGSVYISGVSNRGLTIQNVDGLGITPKAEYLKIMAFYQ